MTPLQKTLLVHLLDGCKINCMSHTQIRVVDASFNPVLRVRYETFRSVKDVLRSVSKGVYVINKNKVRQLHGGTWLKKHYKKQLKSN